jgi:hypothetical protein
MPMLLRPAAVFVGCALLAAAASAEDNCGSMMRTTARFRGTVRSIEPQDRDWFLVTIDVISVEDGAPVPRAGKSADFAIHSPSRAFGPDPVIGKTLDLQAEWMECDGKFRRFVDLWVPSRTPLVERFTGSLDVGHTYRARATWTDGRLTLTKPLHLRMHHDGGVVPHQTTRGLPLAVDVRRPDRERAVM